MSTGGDLARELFDLSSQEIEDEGFELVDVEVVHGRGRKILRFFIDGPDGVSISDCVRVSRVLEDHFDGHDLIGFSYRLEVSSPGLDRPLRSPRDFQRSAGRKVEVFLKAPFEGRLSYEGIIKSSDGQSVKLATPEGEVIEVPLDLVTKGKPILD
jgi:ribosome maturation factor RimP